MKRGEKRTATEQIPIEWEHFQQDLGDQLIASITFFDPIILE